MSETPITRVRSLSEPPAAPEPRSPQPPAGPAPAPSPAFTAPPAGPKPGDRPSAPIRQVRPRDDDDGPQARSTSEIDRALDAATARGADRPAAPEVSFKRQWDDDMEAELESA